MEEYTTGTGQKIMVHDKKACIGPRNCVIHNPSDHVMRGFPTHWRDDRKLMERICPHGIGHPDPDDLAYKEMILGPDNVEGVHGCDFCCTLKDIPGFPGYAVTAAGNVWSRKTKKFMVAHKKDGYYFIQCRVGNKSKYTSVHRAVALAHLPNPKNLPEVNHIDFVRGNNYVGNLEWSSSSNNQKHTYSAGRRPGQGAVARKNGIKTRKLSDESVVQIKKLRAAGRTNIFLAAQFGVHKETISRVLRGITYGCCCSK